MSLVCRLPVAWVGEFQLESKMAGVEEFAATDPVARAGEFGSGPVVPSTRRRMVLRSTPVSRTISRWLVPVASSVATVVRLFGFKTFTLHAPLR
jgi:hypothetical protein